MDTPQRLITETPRPPASAEAMTFIVKQTAEWEGVQIGRYRLAPGETPLQSHRRHEVFVPLRGAVTIAGQTAEGQHVKRRRTAGDVSILPAGIRYAAQWESELDYVAVILTRDFLARATVDFEANRTARLVLACGPQDPLVRSIGQALAGELEAGLPTGRLYAESLVNTLTVHLLRHYSTDSIVPDLQFGGLPAHKLRRVTEFINENLESDLTLTELAQAAELSPYHFARSFKQSTGLTPIQFLMQRRIETAKHLLADEHLPIVEVGLRAGFKNQSHFTTLFRKLAGVTPKAYRNEQQR
jgi:AraC family transcriptional regulator